MLLKFIQAIAPAILSICTANSTPIPMPRLVVVEGGTPAPIKGEPVTLVRRFEKVGRNETCPCGSGKKFKHCCL